MKSVLFVCIENSNRSQLAEAFARMHGSHGVEAFSAGSRPSGMVNPRAVLAMKIRGYRMDAHRSKSIELFLNKKFDAVVTMGCGDDCPFIEAALHEDWNMPDPRKMKEEEYEQIVNEIEKRVKDLLKRLS